MSLSNDEFDSLAPGFLIAAPNLEGSPFEQAVILMIHHDADGAMGFIINKPVEIDFGALIESTDDPMTGEISESSFEQTVRFGGPVRIEQLWLIYRAQSEQTGPFTQPGEPGELEEVAESRFHPNWVLAGSSPIIEAFATGERDAPYHPVIGYSGWGAGQLESEIEEGSWLAVDFDEDLLLETEPEDCWEAALGTVGLDPASFMMMADGGLA